MTIRKDDASDIEAVEIHSAKDLEQEFSEIQKHYQDKETEHNWQVRERAITWTRCILRGNAPEVYSEVLVQGLKNMVDGIIKAVESLRTQLAVKALLLVGDIGVYMGKHLDTYLYDQLLMCMMRCAGLTKKMVATASLQTTITFIRHSNFYPKFTNMLSLAMNDKNTQARLYTIQYTKTVLQTHAHREHTRTIMDKTNCVDHFESIITKGLNDATPAVREVCREAFWIFWEYWRDRGEHLLEELPLTAQKQLEKSKNSKPTRNIDSPTQSSGSLRASSSLGRYEPSPSSSTLSNGSTGSTDLMPRPISRQNGPKFSSPQPYSSPSPPPPTTTTTPSPRKTRVPLNKKKSNMGLNAKRKSPSLITLLNNEDISLRIEGIQQLCSRLSTYPYTPTPNLELIQLETGTQHRVDGETLKTLLLQQFEDPADTLVYETLSTWECVSCVMLRLLNFEDYLPRLILDAQMDESARRSEMDHVRQMQGKIAFGRAKLFLQHENPDLAGTLFISLAQFGGFGHTPQRMPAGKRDIYKLPANRRKLTKALLIWLDELLMPLIGLEPEIEYDVPESYAHKMATASRWFESEANVRECLETLLPLVTTYNAGSLWHGPLVTFIKHLRVFYQELFDSVMEVHDEYSVNKICRILGIQHPPKPALEMQNKEESGVNLGSLDQLPAELIEKVSEEELVVEQPMMRNEPLEQSPVREDMVQEHLEKLDLEQKLAEEEKHQTPVEPVMVKKPLVTEEKQQTTTETGAKVPVEDLEREDQPPLAQEKSQMPVDHHKVENEYMHRDYDKRGLEVIKEYGEEDVVEYDDDNSVVAEEQSRESNKMEDRQWVDGDRADIHKSSHSPEDVYTKPAKTEQKGPDLADVMYDKRLEEQGRLKSPIPDYYHPNMVPPLSAHFPDNHTAENNFYENGSLVYSNHGTSERSTPTSMADMSTSPRQQPEQLPPPTAAAAAAQLQISEPNQEKYPVPEHVPFFYPARVNYPCVVFQSNIRSNAATVSVRVGKDKTAILYTLIDKLKLLSTNTADNVSTFRKLTRLLKEVPIKRRWDQGGSEENGNETWAGGQGDGGNFVELVQGIMLHLNQPTSKSTVSALECIRQLAITQSGLFKVFERKSNDKGMTVESMLTERLLELKANENHTICIAAEDALDSVLSSLTPPTAFEMLMAFVVYRSVIRPYDDPTISGSRYHPVGSALNYVARSVRELNEVFYIEEWLTKGAVNAFFKSFS
ncbi:suppressor of tub2 mutation [Rhizopus stolonifer]|uniref:Suppressor of tub2 mutation n=1 Tax=Rhizopus stolonifer TaxID=4846 RepID=A0A367KPW5_RHIST|nr:suppressor of tub2 mutation [Rhizopus stolonifer]